MAREAGRRVGRPRSEKARRSILAATLELATERGPDGLTMEAIARRAPVSKETIYRWWKSKGEVLLEVLAQRGEQEIPVPDSGLLADDLRTFLRATAAAVDHSTRQMLRIIAAEAAADPTFAAKARDEFLLRRRSALATLLGRAAQRGELPVEHRGIAVDLIYGSLWYRLIFDLGSLDEDWADEVTDAIISQLGTKGFL